MRKWQSEEMADGSMADVVQGKKYANFLGFPKFAYGYASCCWHSLTKFAYASCKRNKASC
jgi:hypothetical protein